MIANLVAAALIVAVEPARLPEQSPAITARVHVTDPAAAPVHKLHLWCSTGTISQPLALGGGRWDAVYTAPAAGRPQWAVIAAWDEEGGEAAATTIALEGRTEFPADTDPGAQVVVQVGSHRASGRADGQGHARVTTLVAPEARSARITAVDAAGNTTLEEVKLDGAPGGVWLVAPPEVSEGVPARVLAFASGGAPITLKVANKGGELQVTQDGPGVLVALVRAVSNVHLVASAEPGHAAAELHYRPRPPAAPEVPVPPPPKIRLAQPRWDVGATVSARFSGAFVSAGVAAEARHRVRAGRWHLGADLFGVYGDGNAQSNEVTAGGLGARAVAELRLPLGPLVAVVFEGAAGAAFVRERRTPVVGDAHSVSDGAPTVALGVGLVAKTGPGLFTLRLEYAWTPLLRLGLANLDGGMIAVGYRYGRF